MWEYGCHSGNWGKYGSEFSAVWSSSEANWAWHYTKDTGLFFVTSYISLYVVTLLSAVTVDLSLRKEEFHCLSGGGLSSSST
jgi:hypothetical protein